MISKTTELCVRGTEEEFKRDFEAARRSYAEAWDAAQTDYDRCVAAHYVGHLTEDLELQLLWHERALEYARRCEEAEVSDFYGSLYACLAKTSRALGRESEATEFAEEARLHGFEVE